MTYRGRDSTLFSYQTMPTSPDAGSLRRGVLLLKLLATAGARGLPLTEIATRAGLPHPSVHRVLAQLCAERLAERHTELRRYRLGPLAFELGVAGSTLHDIRDLCDPAMDRLAEATEDTVYLVVRSGFDAVCLHRREGSFPIRTLVLDIGSRRPLGVGAGGLAILATLGNEERAQVISRVVPSLESYRLDERALVKACAATARRGVSLTQDTVNYGVTAIGCVFRDALGQAAGAISVAAMSQRMTAQRQRSVASLAQAACADVERRVRAQPRAGWHSG